MKCRCCEKLFRTGRGLRQHCRVMNYHTNLNTETAEPKPENAIEVPTYKWGKYTN